MIGQIGHIIIRLTIWFLLTSDLSIANIVIGVAIAFFLPRSVPTRESLKEWFQMLWKVIKAVPLAYLESIEMMLHPHTQEDVILERVKPRRSPQLIFLDIFLITFTPKTIVVKYDKQGWYEVHHVQRRRLRGRQIRETD